MLKTNPLRQVLAKRLLLSPIRQSLWYHLLFVFHIQWNWTLGLRNQCSLLLHVIWTELIFGSGHHTHTLTVWEALDCVEAPLIHSRNEQQLSGKLQYTSKSKCSLMKATEQPQDFFLIVTDNLTSNDKFWINPCGHWELSMKLSYQSVFMYSSAGILPD